MNVERIDFRSLSATQRQTLVLALTIAIALLSSFVLVVHEATQRGEAMRHEQRLTGRIALPSKPPQTDRVMQASL